MLGIVAVIIGGIGLAMSIVGAMRTEKVNKEQGKEPMIDLTDPQLNPLGLQNWVFHSIEWDHSFWLDGNTVYACGGYHRGMAGGFLPFVIQGELKLDALEVLAFSGDLNQDLEIASVRKLTYDDALKVIKREVIDCRAISIGRWCDSLSEVVEIVRQKRPFADAEQKDKITFGENHEKGKHNERE